MSDSFNPSDELLTRYLSGDCPHSSAQAIEAWLATSPENARRLERLRTVLGTRGERSWDVDQMWAKVRTETIDAPSALPERRTATRPRFHAAFSTSRWRVPIAAALLIGVVGTGLLIDKRYRGAVALPARPDVVYQTRRGQTATVQLSDGSLVQLAPQSRLSIPAAFGDSVRDLHLEGEAVFDVHHDASRPFRVRTRNAVTEDIGTRFGIRAYRGDKRVSVVVAEGAVTLGAGERTSKRTAAEGLLLKRGDRGSIDGAGALELTHDAPVERDLAWTHGTLSFTRQRLPDVLATIGRWYDLDIVVADAELARHPVTAEFSSQSPQEMIDALAIAVEGRAERDGRRVTLRRR
ncbi:MAG: FecR domain-containing protein [Gemmatimonadaceae bacterium]|nr:FecR domain-containing protein [Gemmatimonadaceae bacterium]